MNAVNKPRIRVYSFVSRVCTWLSAYLLRETLDPRRQMRNPGRKFLNSFKITDHDEGCSILVDLVNVGLKPEQARSPFMKGIRWVYWFLL
jgi:hypothetical protein